MRRLSLIILSLLFVLLPANAQRRDTVSIKDYILPGTLFTAGAIATMSPWYKENVNLPVRQAVLDRTGGAQFPLDNYLQYAPYVQYIALSFLPGRKNDNLDRALAVSTSILVTAVLNGGLKEITGILRPNAVDRKSFPSGHTATAFLGAELVRREFGPWWGLAAYSCAITTGVLRVWNNWHWTSDVIGGAGMGILGATIGYALMPLERKYLDNRMSVSPVPGGIALCYVF